MINSVHYNAIQGLARSQQGVARTADEISSFPLKRNQGDLNRSLVELHQHEQAAKANVQTLKAADEMLGTLLDEMA